MSPEYLYELADIADPNKLWRLSGVQLREITKEQKQQIDTGVALRRHASDIEDVASLPKGKSLLITPLCYGSGVSRRVNVIDAPLRDGDIAKLANELRDIALQFHGSQQLRERISAAVVSALREGKR